MNNYKCVLYDDKGKKKVVKILAENENQLKLIVAQQDYHLMSYKEIPLKKANSFFSMTGSVKKSEVVVFLRQFSVMLNSGISVDDTLNALRLQNYSKGLKDVLDQVYTDVISGNTLSTAFRQRLDVFPDFFCNMVEIGEMSGTLDHVCASMADYYENSEKLKNKVKSSLAYPIILITVILAVIIFMTYFILPTFEDMFAEFDGEIPGISKIIFGIGAFLRKNMLIIVIVLVSLLIFFFIFFKTKPGKRVKDHMALHFPVIGKINDATITARFARAFSILLASGMNITDAMANLMNILNNVIYTTNFKNAIQDVKRGKSIANALRDTKTFNPLLVQMISVGEKSGNLEEVLNSTTSFFDDQVDTRINKAISLLEPVTIILLGGIVAIVLLAIYVPMIQLMDQI